MAKNKSGGHAHLTQSETILGWLWLPVYLVLLNWGLQALFAALNVEYTAFGLNAAYFGINLIFIVLVFRHFLCQRFFGHGFWEYVQALILGFVLYAAVTWVIRFGLSKLPTPVTIYNNESVADLAGLNWYGTLAISVLAAPIIEETLVRGVVFGSLKELSRTVAYIISCLLFAFMHTWQYFGLYPARDVLLNCLPYLPAAVALAWTYEKSNTIWCPIALHAIINAASFGLLKFHIL